MAGVDASMKIQRGTVRLSVVITHPRAKRILEREREWKRVTRWIGKLTRLHRLRQIDLLGKDWVTELESRPNTIAVSNLTPSSSDNLVIINRSWNGTRSSTTKLCTFREDFLPPVSWIRSNSWSKNRRSFLKLFLEPRKRKRGTLDDQKFQSSILSSIFQFFFLNSKRAYNKRNRINTLSFTVNCLKIGEEGKKKMQDSIERFHRISSSIGFGIFL